MPCFKLFGRLSEDILPIHSFECPIVAKGSDLGIPGGQFPSCGYHLTKLSFTAIPLLPWKWKRAQRYQKVFKIACNETEN